MNIINIKKYIILFILVFLLFSGCTPSTSTNNTSETLSYSGDGQFWTVSLEKVDHPNSDEWTQTYKIKYKGNATAINISYQFWQPGLDPFISGEESLIDGEINRSSSGNGIAIHKNELVMVTIKWDGRTETIELTKQ